jgi:ParB-like nuclease family protein
MPTTVEPTLEMLDPATLLVDLNIREAKLDKDFVASIKDHGVIEPIVAVRTEDGQVRVRHGHRRALGAIEAAQPWCRWSSPEPRTTTRPTGSLANGTRTSTG